ncbi:MAG: peptidyl-prolyl cis-trans isomerase [Gammaproteobacteria bacterium]|nr:MAG: peptidyl-prolyl cis-trans isomerase [Gammaproteobacteria bacterium]RKZ73748.1 MAG: peptidyl-prolyl cis-trans isomerase [Gammaproteobacteria bacterium]
MMKSIVSLLCLFVATQVMSAETKSPVVEMQTNFGTIVLELNAEKAPKTVANFLQYAKDGFYDGTIFHRVIGNFMIQGGGFTKDYQEKKTRQPIPNEANNGLKNALGTIAMARTPNPHSATAQFFINVVDNASLNYKAPNSRGWGYAVFGKVIKGMEVVDGIKKVKTGSGGKFRSDVPQTPVIIQKMSIRKPKND